MSVDSARQSLHPILYNRVGELVDEGHLRTPGISQPRATQIKPVSNSRAWGSNRSRAVPDLV